jgi:hypothetical protein
MTIENIDRSALIVRSEKTFNFKAKNFSNKGLNQKNASHELLI